MNPGFHLAWFSAPRHRLSRRTRQGLRLTLLPSDQVPARDRARALKALDREIAWELEEDGGPRGNVMRLKRLRRMRAALAGDPEPPD